MFFTELIPGTQHTRIAAYENYNGRFFGRLTIYWQETEKNCEWVSLFKGSFISSRNKQCYSLMFDTVSQKPWQNSL